MPTSSRILLLLIVFFGAGLRYPSLFSNHFHADEALFASWARLIAIWRDPLLLAQAVDKPPLLFYLQALAYPLFGAVEWAARIPNLIASILVIPLTAVFAWRVYRQTITALIAALLVAMSPMAVQFSATAFTDPLMVALLLVGLVWLVDPAKPFWAGLFFGLALFTKHQALLFLPLFVTIAWLYDWKARQWRYMLAGFLPVLLLFLGWQLLVRAPLSLWSTQLRNFGGLRIAWSWELLPRLRAWAALWPLGLGSTFLVILFLLAAGALMWIGRKRQDRQAAIDWILVLFIYAYLALHWLLAVPVWDRYMLPLVPLSAVVVGRGLNLLTDRTIKDGRRAAWPAMVLILLLAIVQLPAALAARSANYAVGGQSEADQGAWQVAEYLHDAPYGTVLYDHWFSWHWRYSFIDKGVYSSWFDNPQRLTEDLAVFGSEPGDRYLVLPADFRAYPVLRSVSAAGFAAAPVLQTNAHPGMILYLLEPRGP